MGFWSRKSGFDSLLRSLIPELILGHRPPVERAPNPQQAVPGDVRLILNTHGCEGIGSLIEVLPTNDPPRPDRKDVRIGLVHLDAAADPPPNQMEHCDHAVACIHDLHNLRVVELPRDQKSLGPLPQLGVTVEGAGLWDLGRDDNLASLASKRARIASKSLRFHASTSRSTNPAFADAMH